MVGYQLRDIITRRHTDNSQKTTTLRPSGTAPRPLGQRRRHFACTRRRSGSIPPHRHLLQAQHHHRWKGPLLVIPYPSRLLTARPLRLRHPAPLCVRLALAIRRAPRSASSLPSRPTPHPLLHLRHMAITLVPDSTRLPPTFSLASNPTTRRARRPTTGTERRNISARASRAQRRRRMRRYPRPHDRLDSLSRRQ